MSLLSKLTGRDNTDVSNTYAKKFVGAYSDAILTGDAQLVSNMDELVDTLDKNGEQISTAISSSWNKKLSTTLDVNTTKQTLGMIVANRELFPTLTEGTGTRLQNAVKNFKTNKLFTDVFKRVSTLTTEMLMNSDIDVDKLSNLTGVEKGSVIASYALTLTDEILSNNVSDPYLFLNSNKDNNMSTIEKTIESMLSLILIL